VSNQLVLTLAKADVGYVNIHDIRRTFGLHIVRRAERRNTQLDRSNREGPVSGEYDHCSFLHSRGVA